jgi:transposase-like protein
VMSNNLAELKQILATIPTGPSGKRKFDQAYKSRVVQLYKQGLASSSEITKELGLSTSTLSDWVKPRRRSSQSIARNKFKEIKVLADLPLQGSLLEIHFPNKVVIRNVDWGNVEKMILAVGL